MAKMIKTENTNDGENEEQKLILIDVGDAKLYSFFGRQSVS